MLLGKVIDRKEKPWEPQQRNKVPNIVAGGCRVGGTTTLFFGELAYQTITLTTALPRGGHLVGREERAEGTPMVQISNRAQSCLPELQGITSHRGAGVALCSQRVMLRYPHQVQSSHSLTDPTPSSYDLGK